MGEGRASIAPHPALPLWVAGVAWARPERSLSLARIYPPSSAGGDWQKGRNPAEFREAY